MSYAVWNDDRSDIAAMGKSIFIDTGYSLGNSYYRVISIIFMQNTAKNNKAVIVCQTSASVESIPSDRYYT